MGRLKDEVARLKDEVGRLKDEVGRLKDEVDRLKDEVGVEDAADRAASEAAAAGPGAATRLEDSVPGASAAAALATVATTTTATMGTKKGKPSKLIVYNFFSSAAVAETLPEFFASSQLL